MRQENEKTRSGEYDLSSEELWEKKLKLYQFQEL
jgi:hypothetical protein